MEVTVGLCDERRVTIACPFTGCAFRGDALRCPCVFGCTLGWDRVYFGVT